MYSALSCCFESFCWVVGSFIALKAVYNLGHFIFTTFIGPKLNGGIDISTCGPWAVVTGATDGIGKAYAKALAKKGLNVVLISRNQEKLADVEKEIKECCPSIETKTITADFTHGRSIYDKIKTELDEVDVGMLVNNVGMSFGYGEFHSKIDNDERISDMINCNIGSLARMCRIVIPKMINRTNRGIIINIGSVTSTFPAPLLTLYAATKAFVDKFSQDLAAEVSRHGILVQTILPGYVETNMTHDTPKPSPIISIDAEAFVEKALASLGLERRTAGYWMHKIMLYWMEMANFLIPRRILEMLVVYLILHLEQEAPKETTAFSDIEERLKKEVKEESEQETQKESMVEPMESEESMEEFLRAD